MGVLKNPVTDQRSTRIKFVLYAFCIFACIITTRLFYLQIDKTHILTALGEKNFMRMEIITPLRGDVYDCNKVLLAANRPVFDLYWHSHGAAKMAQQDWDVIKAIGGALTIDFEDEQRRHSLEYAHRYGHRLLLQEDITFEQLCQISELTCQAPHVVIFNRFKRVYPHGTLASHVVGYLSRNENIGQSGLERKFDQELQGQQGYKINVINATGKTLRQHDYKKAQAGRDLALTLDFTMQQLAEAAFEPDQVGALVIMDPENGAIRSLVSFPQFDPNLFLKPLSEETWGQMTVNNPLLNRVTSALYPPASTFKIVAMAAALEEGLYEDTTQTTCLGHINYCGRNYYCINHLGHGTMNAHQALSVSCNIPLFNLGKKIKIDRLAHYAHMFGLGRKTDFLLPEKAGLVPTTAWKKAMRGEPWWRGESLSACIGQSYLQVTPLQVARMTAAVCAGKLVKPRMLEEEPVVEEQLALSPATLEFLRNGLRGVVDIGSARLLQYIRGFQISAKTGTAQTVTLGKEKLHQRYLEHAWLTSYFSYKGSKPLVLTILVENQGHSRYAVQLANRFLRSYRAVLEAKENA
jgi:penicillin-binding protein 2